MHIKNVSCGIVFQMPNSFKRFSMCFDFIYFIYFLYTIYLYRLTDETIHSRIQSGMKKEKKMFEMLLSDNERKFHELESKHRYLIEDKDTLQSR